IISKENHFLLLPPVSLSVMWLVSIIKIGYIRHVEKKRKQSGGFNMKQALCGSQYFGKNFSPSMNNNTKR
ncbi:hypothetical protein MHK_005554, partial [Candidatus Magnetomorum sp. HK-1]